MASSVFADSPVSTNETRMCGDSQSNLVVVYGKNGLNVDRSGLDSLLEDRNVSSVSVVRLTSPTPSMKDEKEEKDEEQMDEYENDLVSSLDFTSKKSTSDAPEIVGLTVEEFYPPEEAKKLAKQILNCAGVVNPLQIKIDYEFQRFVIQNDHCYTPLTSPSQVKPKLPLVNNTNDTKPVILRQYGNNRAKKLPEPVEVEEKVEKEPEEEEEYSDYSESSFSDTDNDRDSDLDFNVNDRGRRGRKASARKKRKSLTKTPKKRQSNAEKDHPLLMHSISVEEERKTVISPRAIRINDLVHEPIKPQSKLVAMVKPVAKLPPRRVFVGAAQKNEPYQQIIDQTKLTIVPKEKPEEPMIVKDQSLVLHDLTERPITPPIQTKHDNKFPNMYSCIRNERKFHDDIRREEEMIEKMLEDKKNLNAMPIFSSLKQTKPPLIPQVQPVVFNSLSKKIITVKKDQESQPVEKDLFTDITSPFIRKMPTKFPKNVFVSQVQPDVFNSISDKIITVRKDQRFQQVEKELFTDIPSSHFTRKEPTKSGIINIISDQKINQPLLTNLMHITRHAHQPLLPLPPPTKGFMPLEVDASSKNQLPAQISIQTHTSCSELAAEHDKQLDLIDSIVKDEMEKKHNVIVKSTMNENIPQIVKMLENTEKAVLNNSKPMDIVRIPTSTASSSTYTNHVEDIDIANAPLLDNAEDELTEDLLQHVAELMDNKSLQEVSEKQVLEPDVPPQLPVISTPPPTTINQNVLVVPPSCPHPPPQPQPTKILSITPPPPPTITTTTALAQTQPIILNVKKEPIQIVRGNGRVITLPPIEAPTTRAKRRAQSQHVTGSPVHSNAPKPAPIKAAPVQRRESVDQKGIKKRISVSSQNTPKDEDFESTEIESSDSEDDPNRLWCICRQPHNNRFMICCDKCEDWFHGKCVNITKGMGLEMEQNGIEWTCPKCLKDMQQKQKPIQRKISEIFDKKQNEEIKKIPEVKKSAPPPSVTALATPKTTSYVIKKIEMKKPTDNTIKKSNDTILKKVETQPVRQLKQTTLKVIEVQNKPSDIIVPPSESRTKIEQKPEQIQSPVLQQNADSSMLSCIVCKKAARPNSIYCSDECIRKHAQNALITATKAMKAATTATSPHSPSTPNDEKKKKIPSSFEEALAKASEPTLIMKNKVERVYVYERKTGRLLTGALAPTTANLKKWLQENPTFEVVQPGCPQALAIEKKKRPPVNDPFEATPSQKKAPEIIKIARTPSFDPARTSTPKLIKYPQQVTLKPGNTQPSTPAKVIKKQPSMEQKAAQPPIPSPTANKEIEPIRLSVKRTLKEQLTSRMDEIKSPDARKLTNAEIEEFSNETENEMFKLFNKDAGTKYKAKYRSLIFNIKDRKNQTLFQKICEKKMEPKQLVRMSPDELASQELAQWRQNENKHQLEMIKKSELDLLSCAKNYVLKTHKGEEVIESKITDRVSLDITIPVEDVVTVLNNSTVSSSSETVATSPSKESNKIQIGSDGSQDADSSYNNTNLTDSNKSSATNALERKKSRSKDKDRDRHYRQKEKHKSRRKSRSRSRDRRQKSPVREDKRDNTNKDEKREAAQRDDKREPTNRDETRLYTNKVDKRESTNKDDKRELTSSRDEKRESVSSRDEKRESVSSREEKRESANNKDERRESTIGKDEKREAINIRDEKRESACSKDDRNELVNKDEKREPINKEDKRESSSLKEEKKEINREEKRAQTQEKPREALKKEKHDQKSKIIAKPKERDSKLVKIPKPDQSLKKKDYNLIDKILESTKTVEEAANLVDKTKTESKQSTTTSNSKQNENSAGGDSDQEPTSTVNIISSSSNDTYSRYSNDTSSIIWKGSINMIDVATFRIAIQTVSGNSNELRKDLPAELDVVGRISPETVWDYIGKIRKSPNKEIVIIRLTPSCESENTAYAALYMYLDKRKRLGVVKTISPNIKDFYILPLGTNRILPTILHTKTTLETLNEVMRPDLLLGIVIRIMGKRPGLPIHHSQPKFVRKTNESSVISNITPSLDEERYTPPHSPKTASLKKLEGKSIISATRLPPKSDDPIDINSIITPSTKISKGYAVNDADEPYSPGGSDDELSSLNTSVRPPINIVDPMTDELKRKMDEINRQIEAQKMEIAGMLNMEQNKAVYSPSRSPTSFTPTLANISIPSNLQQILASIKPSPESASTIIPPPPVIGSLLNINDDEEYVPEASSSFKSLSVPPPPPVLNPSPSRLAMLSEAELLSMVPDDIEFTKNEPKTWLGSGNKSGKISPVLETTAKKGRWESEPPPPGLEEEFM